MTKKLVFYYGTMNSSKTANLIMTAFNFKQQKKPYLIIKSAVDTRNPVIKSRALSTEMEYTSVSTPEDIINAVKGKNLKFLFCDECQFFTEEMIDTLSYVVDTLSINTIAYGLLTDFRGKLFPGSKRLVENADSIREIKNQCIYCDNKANRNMRIINSEPIFEGDTVKIGGNRTYQSVCRSCYNTLKDRG